MMTAAFVHKFLALLPSAALAVRSPRTALILAGRAWQCREGQARRAAWLAAFDRGPFDSIRKHAAPCLLFAGALPLLCALHPSCVLPTVMSPGAI